MSTLTLILKAILAALSFPKELAAFIKLVSDSPEEKRAKINAQVEAWMAESATGGAENEEVEPPKWES